MKFLKKYANAMRSVSGDELAMARCFGQTMKGAARIWFHRLPPRSIQSWEDLRCKFIGAWQKDSRPVHSLANLHNVVHEVGESLRQFNKRFNLVRRSIPGIPMATVIAVYHRNVRDK